MQFFFINFVYIKHACKFSSVGQRNFHSYSVNCLMHEVESSFTDHWTLSTAYSKLSELCLGLCSVIITNLGKIWGLSCQYYHEIIFQNSCLCISKSIGEFQYRRCEYILKVMGSYYGFWSGDVEGPSQMLHLVFSVSYGQNRLLTHLRLSLYIHHPNCRNHFVNNHSVSAKYKPKDELLMQRHSLTVIPLSSRHTGYR